MILSETFCNSIKKRNENIDTRFDEERKINIERNRHIVKTIAEAIHFCGRQCIALRGDQVTLSGSDNSIKYNPGNFLAALQIISKHDEILHQHLSHIGISNRNTKYTSLRIQNEIITIIGYDIIRSDLVKEIKAATFYSILADEVTSHNREELAFCISFVDQNKDIREEFLSFLHVPRITGELIASTMIQFLQDVNLDLKNIRGQGYDGAANMSSDNVGVQRKIKNESPKAVYVHCSGYCLNLVIAHSCSLTNTKNTIAKLKNCYLFFLASPKRESLLQSIIMKVLPDISNPRKGLIDLCRTRWSSRHDSYRHFYQAYCYVIIALEYIAYGANKDACGEDFTNVTWDTTSRDNANLLLTSLTSFDFIISFLTMYQFLSHLEGITVKLQGRTVDIIMAYHEIAEVKSAYKGILRNMDEEFSRIYTQAERMARSVNTEPTKPRTVGRQIMRNNAPAINPEEYYRRNLAIRFLNHISSELEGQFSDLSILSSKLLGLVPSTLCEEGGASLQNVVEFYAEDLPSADLFPQELFRWKHRFQNKPPEECPSTTAQALKECNEELFPNIFTLLKIYCSIPATSCECERSASALRRPHTYSRASMKQERLSALALMHIHYGKVIDEEKIVDILSQKYPRQQFLF